MKILRCICSCFRNYDRQDVDVTETTSLSELKPQHGSLGGDLPHLRETGKMSRTKDNFDRLTTKDLFPMW